MATKIIHKKSSVASSVPAAGDLEPGELAINLADQKLYSKTTGGTVIPLGGITEAEADAKYLLDSELTSEASVKALNQGVATTDSPSFSGLTVDTNTLYVDSASNSVGIGTTTPGGTLGVKGTASIGNSSLVESWMEVGQSVAAGSSRGAIYLYGAPTGYSTGGTIYFYAASDHDTNNQWYTVKTSGEDWVFERADGSDVLTYDYSASQWLMPQSGGLSVTGDITAANVSAGVSDTSAGILTAYGDGAGSTGGGRLRLYTAADHDTNLNYYAFNVLSEDLFIEASTGQDLLRYDWDLGAWHMGQLDNSKGTLYLAGDGTGSVNGGELRIYNAADHDTNVNFYSLYAESEDFLISYGATDFLQYDYSASQWLMPQSGGLDVTGNITAANITATTITSNDAIYIGQDDTTLGSLFIYGPGTGTNGGGEIFLYTSADNDTNVDRYQIRAFTEDFYVQQDGNTILRYDYSASAWLMPTATRLDIGTNDTTFGELRLYGEGTGSGQGGMIRLYNSADNDTTNEGYNIKAWNDSLTFELQAGTDIFTYNNADGSFRFPEGKLYAGTNDSKRGALYLFGDGTGSTLGGEIFLYTGADHDTSPDPNYYHIRTISEDLYITASGTLLQWDNSASQWIMPASGGLDVTGNITVGGTVDGRDVAVDGTKLDGIEAGATADMTASEILTAIKTVDGPASGLNADLLDGNHASVFVTLEGTQTLTNKTLTNPTITGTIIEDVYTLSGTTPVLDPTGGSIQTWTLIGNSTPTDSLAAGEAITLMIDDGTAAYTVTWPTMTWVNNGGTAPTLATTGYTVIALWKVSTTLYGALVGDGS